MTDKIERLIATVLADPDIMAELADVADREGRTILADLIDEELQAMAEDPLALAPTPALKDVPTLTEPEEEMSPYFGREAPMSRVPTVEDVMKAISTQAPLDPSELKDMPPQALELLRARLGLALSAVEKAMGVESTFLLDPKEQEKREEAETLRGTIGATKLTLSKRADILTQPIPSEPHRQEVETLYKKLGVAAQLLKRLADQLEMEKNETAAPLMKIHEALDDIALRLMNIGMPLMFQGEPLHGALGAAKPSLSKRGGAWEHTPEAAIEYLKKREKEKGEDTYLSKYPFPEKASGAVSALEPLHRVVSETVPRIREMAKEVGWQLLNNLPEDRAELERLWSAASSLYFEMADTGEEYIKTVSSVAQRTADQMEEAEQKETDQGKWAELEPLGRRLLEALEPFSKGEEWYQEPARTIKLLRENLDKGFRPRLIHQTEGYIERAQKILQRLQAGEEPGFSYER